MKAKFLIINTICILLLSSVQCYAQNMISLSCRKDNDLYQTLQENKIGCIRYNTPGEAIDNASPGTGVLILADGYPEKTTVIADSLYERAIIKELRLYVEYPSHLPGIEPDKPIVTKWERAVISSDSFGPALGRLRILAIHDCHLVNIKSQNPDIVMARVAGLDSAVYGLPKETFPVMCRIPQPDGKGELLVATTKLSQFITARYAPEDGWRAVWQYVFKWLLPGKKLPVLKWKAYVRPGFGSSENLPAGIERLALRRGIDWFYNSHLILHPAMMNQYNKPANFPSSSKADSDPNQDWPYGHRTAKMIENPKVGDGTMGIMEGYDSKIFSDGSQAVRWWNRGDCNGGVAGAMALAGLVLKDSKYIETSANLGNWLFFNSMISLGDRADPDHPSYGLSGWNDTPQYAGPGSSDGYTVYYGDGTARTILGMMIAAAARNTDRYDKRLLNILLANLRISGVYGFQPDRLDQGPLVKYGWEHYFTDKNVSYSPHYQAYMLSCYLWAYHQTGFDLFLKRAETAISMMMAAYPHRWKWTNGIQQERAKMLLPLAWLVRVDDTPEHREWLKKIAGDLLSGQDKCGALREEIGEPGKGGFPPPSTNEAYGTSETSLLQNNGDCVTDLLYTADFAFLGLHEAAAASGEKYYLDAEDKLAKFLCRIQISSEKHPELDGGWFRAFDFKRWEYWASNGDSGWGAWSIETGWTQSWVTIVLSLRQINSSIWEFTKDTKIDKQFEALRKQMLPDEVLQKLKAGVRSDYHYPL